MSTPQSSTVVVVGGGYAGTMAANRIAGHDGAQVILINPRPQFVHRIRLHQWATGTGDAAVDYGTVLGERVRLVVDAVTRIDVAAGRVELESGDALPYDHLVYAVGSTGVAPSTIPGAAEHGYLIGEWEAAQALRSRLEGTLPDAPTTVVGGGLTGIEMSAELGEAGRQVRLVCRGEVATSFGPRARRRARAKLRKLGVELIEEHRVASVAADTITIVGDDGVAQILPSTTTILAAGFGVPGIAAASGLTTDALGRLITDETLTSVDDPRIVGAGDAVAPSGQPFRMSCQAANQLGPHAADTVLARLRGKQPAPVSVAFVGQCMSLGRHGAVVQLTRRDDTPRRTVISGRTGAAVKEMVCRSVAWGLRMEARRPGFMPSVGGQERVVGEPLTSEVRA
ncbi:MULTISPECIES: NAD(P)/FAD-dependent oxidoreductase [unclassified Gordonia (in: high G+C Gram-positive bacteria)]|uniref:NAD(P)/FAD-dependent oxidoreductase n=1 Tax=unclassified Gordonia (in: high G+C Gram-positive bacteria) TaxID=2657482 RepID=UPI001F0F4EDE|nr:FAD-dependent oxidoreductase [Gordonia sp. ABSL49_1]MCH5641570.1 FAD-dependent oxidoreductase [Gordonia sp. ABSL49_1]